MRRRPARRLRRDVAPAPRLLLGTAATAHVRSDPVLLTHAWRVLGAAVWHGDPEPDVDAATFDVACRLASRNLCRTLFVNAYPNRFGRAEHERLERSAGDFCDGARDVGSRLQLAGVSALLLKGGLGTAPRSGPGVALTEVLSAASAAEYGDLDLVVGTDGWSRALAALAPWSCASERHLLEPGKVLLRPVDGPAAHLHRTGEWFGVPVFSTTRLRQRARQLSRFPGLLVPAPPDLLRVWVAHAVFQNLAFDLSELLQLRSLTAPELLAEAQAAARAEGWGTAFARGCRVAQGAMAALDEGRTVPMPVRLPVASGLAAGFAHAAHLLRAGRVGAGVREIALRPALVAAKWRRGRLG